MANSENKFILTYDGQRASSVPFRKLEKPIVHKKISLQSVTSPEILKLKSRNYITQEDLDRYVGPKENLTPTDIRLLLRYSQDSVRKNLKDESDYSNHPSYTKLKAPYFRICRERYKTFKKTIEHQYHSEIENIVAQQANAFDAVCCVRVLSITSLWPPLHTHRQIDESHKIFELSPKQKKRLAYIMRIDWSKT